MEKNTSKYICTQGRRCADYLMPSESHRVKIVDGYFSQSNAHAMGLRLCNIHRTGVKGARTVTQTARD